MIELLTSLLLGVISSTVASLVYAYLLLRKLPNIDISPEIARTTTFFSKRKCYKIKIINRSKRPAINIRAELHLIIPYRVGDNILIKSKKLSLKREELTYLSRFNVYDRNAEYSFRFITYEELEKLLKKYDGSFLRFRIFAQDSFSNFSKVFSKIYTIDSIKEGEFKVGDSFKIIAHKSNSNK